MLQLDNCIITNVIIHKVGNAYAEELSVFSANEILLEERDQKELIKLLKPFKNPMGVQQFSHSVELQQNTF
jgi:hypothetical protein